MKHELAYKIKGKKILTNVKTHKLDKENNLICSTNKSLEDIKMILDSIDMKFSYSVFLCKQEDWIKSYQDSIKPILIEGFYITPSWVEKIIKEEEIIKAEKNKNEENNKKKNIKTKTIILDPSLSFGSGHHESTSSCISLLSKMDLKDKNFLDVGCGSGILSLVASFKEAKTFLCDTDANAIAEATKNFRVNNASYEEIFLGSLQDFKNTQAFKKEQKLDLICANIVASILILLKNEFIKYLKKDGILILSGILDSKLDTLLEEFSEFKVLEKIQKNEWVSLKMAFK